jgi:predicted lipid-binding transport protein (Tim44 family)
MKTYTLHLAADASPHDAAALDRAVLVKDGFSWGAFFFSFLWFFAHRLWLAGLIVLVAIGALAALLQGLRIGSDGSFWAILLLAFLVGLEASSLRRWTLARSGRPAVGVVAAKDLEEAETKAFARWLDEAPASAPAAAWRAGPAAPAAYRRPDPVIGLFPEAERTR